jgi:hypothetical protein
MDPRITAASETPPRRSRTSYRVTEKRRILAAVVSANPGLLGLGVDEATALEVHGVGFRVLGCGSVTVVDGPKGAKSPLVLRSGSRYGIGKREGLLTRSWPSSPSRRSRT